MDLDLEGKAAIVTGAGRGIGKAIALTFAKEGVNVVINDIGSSAADTTAKEAKTLGAQALAIKADVTNPDQVNEMVRRTLDGFKKVDILVNNAGIIYSDAGPATRKLFANSTPGEWQGEINLILYGVINCTKAVIEHMMKRKSGRIVNIASDAGRTGGFSTMSLYGAAKGGVIAFTKQIATEVASYGITVNVVSPGFVKTTRAIMAERQKETNPESYNYYKKHIEEPILKTIPLGRIGEPQDIANMVVFLVSDAASWVTGQTISVNGGQVML